MKSLLTAIALGVALSTMTANIALADKGRGGGRTIDIKGRRALMDLAGSTCYYREGADVEKETPSFAAVITTLKQTHWYLGSLIESEIKALRFCFTKGKLPQIPITDLLGVTIYQERGEQTGVRFNQKVFVQEQHFLDLIKGERLSTPPVRPNELVQLDPRHFKFMAGYFLIHEIIHSFIPYEVDQRDSSVMSIVAMIARNHLERMSPKEFALQIEENQLEVPGNIAPLKPYREAIEVVVNDEAPLAERTKAAYALAKVLKEKEELQKYLVKADRELIQSLAYKETVIRNKNFATAVTRGNEDEVIRVYKSGGRLTSDNDPSFYHNGETGVAIAIERGFFRHLALLMEDPKADVYRVSFEKGPIAVFQKGQPELALALLNHPTRTRDLLGEKRVTYLRQAVEAGWDEGVRQIMNQSSSGNDTDLIALAMEKNKISTAKVLMNFQYGRFPTDHKAVERILNGEWPELMAFAQTTGIKVYLNEDHEQFLLKAVRERNSEVFRRLSKVVLAKSQYSNQASIEKVLVTAIETGQIESALEMLKQKNLMPTLSADVARENPFVTAIRQGHLSVVKAVVAHPNFIFVNGHLSSLTEAMRLNYTAAVRELLSLGDSVATESLMYALRDAPKTAIESKKLVDAALQIRYAQAKATSDAAARRRMNQ